MVSDRRMRIGELAEFCGVSTRAIRHYHRIGLLPDPPRRGNGYRVYGMRDVLRLARVRRLVELGLSLDEAADVLADDEGRELGEILAELDADLARQEVEIRERRERLGALLRRGAEGPLDADDAVSPPTADLLDRISTAFPGSAAARLDREVLALLDGSGTSAVVAEHFRDALDDPEVMARSAQLYGRFDELAAAAPDDPRIPGVARDFAAAVPPELTSAAASPDAHPLTAALLRDLPAAQAEVLRQVHRIWTAR
jgi:DNA-binding transcriptional MerR regulator